MRSRALLLTLIALAFLFSFAGRKRPARPQPAAPPTFSNEVVRILQQRCQSCHRPGDIAPFSLMSFEEAKPWAQNIKFMTETRQMPPWKPVVGCGDFAGSRRLTDGEIATIKAWVDAGAPEGDRAQLPPPVVATGDWFLGTPDAVLEMEQTFTPPRGQDTYRCFPLTSSSSSAQYVSAIDILPGDRSTVHHVIAYIDTTGESAKLDAAEEGPGYTCFGGPGFPLTSALGGWAPGSRPAMLPEGVAIELPANARVVMQVHYHPHGDHAEPDLTRMGVYFSRTPVEKRLRFLPLINTSFMIPAGASNHQVTASLQLPPFIGLHAVSITPHMHLLGKTMKVTATLPSGATQCLIEIDDWDFHWQGTYNYVEPVALPALTFLSLTATFDNSSSNPRNPNNPPQPVGWGEATTDEMCIAFLGITVDAENLQGAKVEDDAYERWIGGVIGPDNGH